MISKEEAKELSHDGSGFLTQETVCLIDEIYDSIGSCGECAYYSPSGTCIVQYGDKGLCLDKTEYDFCSDFKRRT